MNPDRSFTEFNVRSLFRVLPPMMRPLTRLAWGCVLLLALGACGGEWEDEGSGEGATETETTTQAAGSKENLPNDASGEGSDDGYDEESDEEATDETDGDTEEEEDFSGSEDELWVVYEEPEEEDYQPLYESLQRSDFYGDVALDISDMLQIPSEVGVYFDTCDESNAFYYSEDQEILMCYELIEEYLDLALDGEDLEGEDYDNAVINASLFTFFHELGHALVDVLELPITGREEDVVDEFATLLLLWWEDEEAVWAGAEQFEADALAEREETTSGDYAYWDEHGLSAQRYYNVICLIYGSDPQYWQDLVKSRELPQDRADQCAGEFDQKTYAWETILDPYWEE